LDILHAAIATAPKIQKTFLQSRQDVNAQIDGLASGSDKILKRINILCTVSRVREGTDMFVSLTAFRPYGEAQSGFLDSYIQPLVTWKLPEHPEGVSARLHLQCCLNLKLGLVHVATSETIATYDFTQPVPKIMSILSDQRSSILGQIALPGGSLLTASRAGYILYDIKFNSILDQRYSAAELSQPKKRKRDASADSHVDVQIVDYYSDLGIVAVLRGRELSCIQVAKPQSWKQSETSCLLADALGKGVNTTSHPQHIANEDVIHSLGHAFSDSVTFPASANWNGVMEQLGDLAEKEDVNEFERLMANHLGIAYDAPKQNGVNGTTEHHEPPNTLQWKFPDPHKGAIKAHRHKAISALRLIFSWEDRTHLTNGNKSTTPSSPLSIQFFPPCTFHWLVITGQLNRSNLDHAFRLYPSDADSTPSLLSSSLVDAIVQFDPSLQLLFSVINHHLRLEIPELVQSIKYVIQSLTGSGLPAPMLALTNGDHSMANGDDDHSINHEADDAMDDVDFVISTLENGIPMRGEAIRRILTQLNAFSNAEIAESFRQLLSQSEIVQLMNILRLELEDSGWVSRYIDPDPTAAAEFGVPSNHAISIISKILSSAVDAIGVSGWLAPSNDDSADPVDELLLALRAETSIVLEGIHEATFMVDMLDQFLHYAEKKRTEFTPNPRISGAAIKTLAYQTPDLPLGLGLHSELSKSRMSVGGKESHRSKRDIGRQISMRVPKYSFDRIRI
jgi:hypothetical protein